MSRIRRPTPIAKPRANTNLIYSYITSKSSENAKTADVRQFFKQLFKDEFSYESDAEGADGYVRGRLVLECKTDHNDWLAGLYQGLHYAKLGLGFAHVAALSYRFIGLWRIDQLPQEVLKLAHQAPPILPPHEIGRYNASKTSTSLKNKILESADKSGYLFNRKEEEDDFSKGPTIAAFAFMQKLMHLDERRVPVTPNNFLGIIEEMKPYFSRPLEAIHAFYDIVRFWDVTSNTVLSDSDTDSLSVVGKGGIWISDPIRVKPGLRMAFKHIVDRHYVFTNEGSGITTDYYFSRFDEVMQKLEPEYVKQHGIYFTSHNLSKLALWFVDNYVSTDLTDDYVVLDPAGGSGNLVRSWRRHVKHKIISELQPDLLRIIDRRLQADPWEVETGYTIVPKVNQYEGLNFINRSAQDYYDRLKESMRDQKRALDKPFAFLLNPPYKNTDEGKSVRDKANSSYSIDPSILELTGPDAANERYVAFLGQIHRLAEKQISEHPDFQPVLMVFTPTSWLIPKKTYLPFRRQFDKHWEYQDGFIITSNEFFKLNGKWPLAFSVWRWRSKNDLRVNNDIVLRDLSYLKQKDFRDINWAKDEEDLAPGLHAIIAKAGKVYFNISRPDIREMLPSLSKGSKEERQTRYDFSRKKSPNEIEKIVSGFPLKSDKHNSLGRKCGDASGSFVGFMDNLTPVRLKQDSLLRMSNKPDRVWFRLDLVFSDFNKGQCFSGAPDNRGYCAYDLESAKATFAWFGIAKSLNGEYPLWANQLEAWKPDFDNATHKVDYFYRLCYAYALAENSCVVTSFEANNPVQGVPEIFVDNPLCPINPESFWSKVLVKEFLGLDSFENPEFGLVNEVTNFYKFWANNYCHNQVVENVGLHKENYFVDFNYSDYLTTRSGLLQIRKFAERNPSSTIELIPRLEQIRKRATAIKQELKRLLVEEFLYFQ